jgi:hypothetical protein
MKTPCAGKAAVKRRYSAKTLKILFARSGNRCAEPGCKQALVVPGTSNSCEAVVGQIAHIYAVSKKGPRGSQGIAEAARNEPSNLILLCPTHHTLVDMQHESYPATLLLQWKQQAEHALGVGTPHPHDVELLRRVREKLSPSVQAFLIQHDFRNPLPFKKMGPLWDMMEGWTGVAYKFHDPSVQAAFADLMNKIANLTSLVVERIFPDDRNSNYGSPLTEVDRMRGLTMTTRKGIKEMNNSAISVTQSIEHFEEVARSLLRI